jgi:hypothetical protein
MQYPPCSNTRQSFPRAHPLRLSSDPPLALADIVMGGHLLAVGLHAAVLIPRRFLPVLLVLVLIFLPLLLVLVLIRHICKTSSTIWPVHDVDSFPLESNIDCC